MQSVCLPSKRLPLIKHFGAVTDRVDVFRRVGQHWAEVRDVIVPLAAQVHVVLSTGLLIVYRLNTPWRSVCNAAK